MVYSYISRSRKPGICLADELHPTVDGNIFANDLGSRIGRPVVDNDYLDVAMSLPDCAVETFTKVFLGIVSRYDYGYHIIEVATRSGVER